MTVIGKKEDGRSVTFSSWLEVHYKDCTFAVFPDSGQVDVVIGDTPSLADITELSHVLGGIDGPYRLVSARYSPRNFRFDKRFARPEELVGSLGKLCARPEHFYHGTLGSRLGAIGEEGLRNDRSGGGAWDSLDPKLAEWCSGKLFLTPDIDNAMSYAEQKASLSASEDEPVLLRVKGGELAELGHDHMGMGVGEVFVTHSVAVEHVECLVDGTWRPLSEMQVTPSIGGGPSPYSR